MAPEAAEPVAEQRVLCGVSAVKELKVESFAFQKFIFMCLALPRWTRNCPAGRKEKGYAELRK